LKTEQMFRHEDIDLQFQDLDEAKRENVGLVQEVNQLKAQCKVESEEASEKLETLRNTITNLESQVEEKTKRCTEIEVHYEKAMVQIADDYEKELEAQLNDMVESKQLRTQESLRDEIMDVKLQYQGRIQELEGLVAYTEMERANLFNQCQSLQEESSNLQAEMKFLLEHAETMARDNNRLQEELVRLQALSEKAEAKSKELESMVANLEAQFLESKQAYDSLRQENDLLGLRAEESYDDKICQKERASNLELKLRSLLNENESLQDEISQLKNELLAMEWEKDSCQMRLLELEAKANGDTAGIEIENAFLKEKLNDMKDEYLVLQNEVERTNSKLNEASSDATEWREKSESLEMTVKELQSAIAQKEAELEESIRNQIDVQKLKSELEDALKKEKENLREQCVDAEGLREQISRLKESGAKLEMERCELLGEVSKLKSQLQVRSGDDKDESTLDFHSSKITENPAEDSFHREPPTVVETSWDVDQSSMSNAYSEKGSRKADREAELILPHELHWDDEQIDPSIEPSLLVGSSRSWNSVSDGGVLSNEERMGVECDNPALIEADVVRCGRNGQNNNNRLMILQDHHHHNESRDIVAFVSCEEFAELRSRLEEKEAEAEEQGRVLEALYDRCRELEEEHGSIVHESLEWVNAARRAYEVKMEAKTLEIREEYGKKIHLLEGQLCQGQPHPTTVGTVTGTAGCGGEELLGRNCNNGKEEEEEEEKEEEASQ